MTTENPTISIALLVKNGMPELKNLLTTLRGQQGCEPFEIVAVDSGSTDGSLDAMLEAQVRVTRIPPESFRFGTTRQFLFSLTRGKAIVTLSQDAMPGGSGWLAEMTEPILAGSADVVQAREEVPAELKAQMQLFYMTSCYQHWASPYVEFSCSGMAISRNAWEQTGFGQVPMSEDKELARRARGKNMRVTFCSRIPLIHGHAFGVVSLAKRSFNEGMGARYTDGRYSSAQLCFDLLGYRLYKQIISLAIKHRMIPLSKALTFIIRPLFLYLGIKLGKRYWR